MLKERDKKLTDLISTIRNQTRVLTYNSSVVDRYLNNRWENEYLNRQATEKMETLVTSIYISNPEIHSIEVGSYEEVLLQEDKSSMKLSGRRLPGAN